MSTRYRPCDSLRRQRGLAMVEFAITAPVLLLLMFGSFEFGHLMIEYSALNDAVRNAARYVAGSASAGAGGGLVTGGTWSTLVMQTQNLAVFGNIAGNGPALLPGLAVEQITVTADTTNKTPNNNITVVAAYPYKSLFGAAIPTFMGGSISDTYTLAISTTMRAL
jgi:Flp pilus assembly protein TadG